MGAEDMWEEALYNISIPLWFDYGKEMKERDCTTHQHFNSTMVRLWASIPFTCSVKVVYFNSTMVRLWGNTGFAAYQPRRISIPLWFDYGGTQDLLLISRGEFQFHYGSIMGFKASNAFSPSDFISIPLWFDYGQKAHPCRFTKHKISIPLWFDYGKGEFFNVGGFMNFNSTMVRLWVSAIFFFRIISQNFNSTMVRLWVTAMPFQKGNKIFQFHYGSIMGFIRSLQNTFISGFQFHYGSIMGSFDNTEDTKDTISIPLWFDYGEIVFATASAVSLFQFHYGSIMG